MQLVNIPFEVIVSGADETVTGIPEEQVKELALRKAKAVQASEFAERICETAIIIAADTLVYIDGKILEKPDDEKEAFEMLKTLSGRKHAVYTGVAILNGNFERVFADVAYVQFHSLTDSEINAYIATSEPFDKAGAYGVQERGAVLVEKIEGDFYTVVGLPISKVCRALSEIGYNIWQ